MSKLIEKEQSIIFIEDSSDTFNFCISIITTEYSMEKSRKYQISCEIDLINKNGAFVKWQPKFIEPVQEKPELLLPTDLGSRLNCYFNGNYIKFLFRHAVYFTKNLRKHKQPISEVQVQQSKFEDSKIKRREREKQQIDQIRQEICTQIERDLKVVSGKIRMLGYFCSLPLFKMDVQKNLNVKMVKRLLKLKKVELSFRKQVSILLSKVTKIKVANTCKASMQITIETASRKKEEDENKLVEIIQSGLGTISKCIFQANRKKSAKNIFIIESLSEEPCRYQIIGGVSAVQKRKVTSVKVFEEANPHKVYQFHDGNFWMGKKYLKDQTCSANAVKRFERELDIIRKIVRSSQERKFYLLDYYMYKDKKDHYYLDWKDESLATYLEKQRNWLSVQQLLNICIQIVLMLIDLHQSGVVHRDLKPSNLMLDFSLGWRFPILKLIDYSDSMVIDEKHRLEVVSGSYKVYSTPAYCPLESSTFNEKYEQQGLINPKVDNWSLGVVLFEVLNGYLPISYSTCTTKDIHALWKYQFMNTTHHQKQYNLGSIKNVIDLVSYELIKMQQEDRLELNKALAILILTQFHIQKLKRVLEE